MNSKKFNLIIFGTGNVGSELINQLLSNKQSLESKRGIDIRIVAIANSQSFIFNQNGITENWLNELKQSNKSADNKKEVIEQIKKHQLTNLIFVDNTADSSLPESYTSFIEAGCDIVSSNKIGNTKSYSFYSKLRNSLEKNQKSYLYETNVGAGLPIIDTIRLLHDCGENITRIQGVFSGTLSYLFNTFSESNQSFSQILQSAIELGYTEPDPREDLCGNDVARKLLILARELELENEIDEIPIENLVPKEYRNKSKEDFLTNLNSLNSDLNKLKKDTPENYVIRYVGELSGDLSKSKGNLDVKLKFVPKNSPLGSLQGSDVLFEIFTESYGDKPVVIQGAGAGAKVTARGVFGDILRTIKARQSN